MQYADSPMLFLEQTHSYTPCRCIHGMHALQSNKNNRKARLDSRWLSSVCLLFCFARLRPHGRCDSSLDYGRTYTTHD